MTICINQLTVFHNSFDGNVPHRAQLQVLVTDVEKICKVDFRNTREKTGKENFLSSLNLRLPSPRIARQVSLFSNYLARLEELNFLL